MTDLRPRGGGPTPVGGPEDEVVVPIADRPTYADGLDVVLKDGDHVRRQYRTCTVTAILWKDPEIKDPKYVRTIQVAPSDNPQHPLPVKPQPNLPGHEITISLGPNNHVPPVGRVITVQFERPADSAPHIPYKAFKWEPGEGKPSWA